MIFFPPTLICISLRKSSTEALITRLVTTDCAASGCTTDHRSENHRVANFRYGNYKLWLLLSHRRTCQHLNFCFTHSISSRTVIRKNPKLNSNPTLRNPLENSLVRNSILRSARSSNQLIYQSSSVACLLPRSQQEIKIILMGQTTNLRISKKICITTLCKTVNGWRQCFDAASSTFLHTFQILCFLNLASAQ